MSQSANILQELRELESSLAGQPVRPVFSVPENYFEGLADVVLNRIKALEAANASEELEYLSPQLSEISKDLPYHVPTGYFDGLSKNAERVMDSSQSARDEMEKLSPLLAGINREMPFAVPQGYFENFKPLKTVAPAKVVTMSSRRWFKFAAAAVITGVIALAGFVYFNSRPDPIKNPDEFVAKKLKKVPTTVIDEFVELTNEETLVSSTNVTPVKTEEIKELMKDISDKELQDFLNETPDAESVDVLLN